MVTQVQITEAQIKILIADAAGIDPEKVTVSVVNAVGEPAKISASLATDLKAASKLDRTLAKYSKPAGE